MSELPEESRGPGIAHDLLCMRCGYNLRTMAVGGLCPGCGLGVGQSLGFERSMPPLGAGCVWLMRGALLMVALGVVNLCVHLASNLTYDGLGREVWLRIFSPALAVVRVADLGMLFTAVGCFARARLAPRGAGWQAMMPLLVLGLMAMAGSTLVLAVMNWMESPGGRHITLGFLRLRYGLYVVQTGSHLPVFVAGLLYFGNLARRPEFAGFRAYVRALFAVDLFFWAAYGVTELYLLATLFVWTLRPPAAVWNLARALDWLDLAAVVPELIFWWLLARRAGSVRAAAQL